MAKHKYNKLLSRLLREIVKLSQTLTGQTLRWLLRYYFVANRWRQNQAGFVLPTVAMMLMVVALVVGAIMFRTFRGSIETIGMKQEQLNANSAYPAIERGKAKLEYLFNDPRLASGVPDEKVMEALILNDGSLGISALESSPYRFPDETPVEPTDIGVKLDDGITKATAWKFNTDKNGDGKTDGDEDLTTIYAIVTRAERNGFTIDPKAAENDPSLTDIGNDDKKKADNFIVRNGPIISLSGNHNPACMVKVGGNPVGWFNPEGGSSSAYVYKSFQVYAIAVNNALINGKSLNATLSTLQYQQDRAFERGNKWGAWFRYDLEIAPGPSLNWNGAMHSQGNIFLRSYEGFRSYLISSPKSCFFKIPDNSSITMRKDQPVEGEPNSGRGGQLVSGRLSTNNYEDSKVYIDPFTDSPTASNFISLSQGTDSVKNGTPIDISTDPVDLHTQAISKPKNAASWSIDPNWQSSTLSKQRVNQKDSCAPYVDDTYRADNRWGPKPSYSRETYDTKTGRCIPLLKEGAIGTDITTTPVVTPDRVTELTVNDPPPNDKEGEKVGLDGYWERRARFNGLRVIVGQRLELGNPFGWNLDADGKNSADQDLYPLVPPIKTTETETNTTPNWAGTTRRNEARQYTTLRDNLAAVQATAVYHYTSDSGYFPVAFVATTVHPGTAQTLKDSTKFENIGFVPKGGTAKQNYTIADFFYGKGTNGWEFNVVPGATQTEAAFKSAIENNQPLRRALTNLAYFAGDPDGDFPPNQEPTNSTTVHPYPNLTMWGNFSNLRETIRRLDAGNYDNLSIADKSNLHTAAGMLGMLAYNISYLQDYDYSLNSLNSADLKTLNGELGKVSATTTPGYGKVEENTGANTVTVTLPGDTTALPAQPMSLLPDAYIAALPETTADQKKIKDLARLIHLKEQAERDRTLGFMTTQTGYTCAIPNNTTLLKLQKLCPQGPKFPSLYYLFPKYNHDHQGKPATGVTVATPALQPTGATGEPYVTDTYIYDDANKKGANWNLNYQVLDDTSNNGVEDGTENGIAAIALQPRALADWKLPKLNNGTGENGIIDATTNASADTPNVSVPFLDKAIFDGRQMMSVRVLDVDLKLLLQNSISSDDTWLPKSAIVYAFREDAVREDGIARPVGTGNMDVWKPSDPALVNGISPKPVDFLADPDRRPYGFRLRNGKDLRRVPQKTNPKNKDYNQDSGLSFVSDSPVYIGGDFNPHSTNGTVDSGNLLEEFTEPLNTDYSNFYSRQNLNVSFAKAETDTWRPAEIISDAVSILSNTFCDGTIQSGIRANNGGCKDTRVSSYRGGHWKGDPSGMAATGAGYVCENPFDIRTGKPISGQNPDNSDKRGCVGPIKVFRNGEIKFYNASGTPTSYALGDYRTFSENRQLNIAGPGRVNAVIISGTVPSRQNQSNGGLHNFPRFLENWASSLYATGAEKELFFSGSLVQLNFSTYATGPWDQDAWEPGTSPTSPENFKYYWPPKRRWGYDVGLQYAPPGNVSRRMVLPSDTRSEFYREPNADDKYICRLRKAIMPSTNCGG
ncbi:MAG: hormogonium polysaccharide biosynthesis protein HpsA [Oscillatoria princeps RMCB-10]|jgi:hypothetical protein|nr:hormogonium polysaccharide biosynthesis protein HpsA [Oscillatoria princeps RMCB-10]